MAGLKRQITFFLLFLSAALTFLLKLSGCGLEEFYYLEPPRTDGHTAYSTTQDKTTNYFSFITTESGFNASYIKNSPSYAGSEFECLGTEVYYKIYNASSSVSSVADRISSLNSSTSSSTSAAEYLTETAGYKTLRLFPKDDTPLITATGQNRYVYIRLSDYGTEFDFKNVVRVGDKGMKSWEPRYEKVENGEEDKDNEEDDDDENSKKKNIYEENPALDPTWVGFPRRHLDSDYGFNFYDGYKSNDNYNTDPKPNGPVPLSGDDDVRLDTADESGIWYVDMYAATIGHDSTYTYSYSKVLHLGTITIDESDYK